MKRRDLLQTGLGAVAAASLPYRRVFGAEIAAMTLSGSETFLTDAEVNEFVGGQRGVVLQPDSIGYDVARKVWNAVWDKRPALIARCTNVDDVINAVNFGRSHNLLTAVRCGGHSASGKSVCEGGLVIDLSYMNTVEIDVAAKTARVDGGALLANLDRKALPLGLATTSGYVSHTGIGGLTLGGGVGRLHRKFGLAIDNVLGVEVVTADGKHLRANEKENSELYWGVRGGGGNFGIVTKFIIRLHSFAPEVHSFRFSYPLERAEDVLNFYFDYSSDAHQDLFVNAGLDVRADGGGGVGISGNFYGADAELDRLLQPIRTLGRPLSERTSKSEYVKVQSVADGGTNAHGYRHYSKAGFITEIKPGFTNTLVERAESLPTRGFGVSFLPLDGAVHRVGPSETPWAHRNALYNLSTDSTWSDPDPDVAEKNVKWNRAYWTDIESFTNGGFYINSLSADDGQQKINANHGPNHDRLVAVKDTYDPTNFFRLNANIVPTIQRREARKG